MCNPISLIVTEDKIFLPPEKVWNHSHTFIMKENNIPDGLLGDKYLRLEVTQPEENVFRDKKTNKKLVVNNTWKVIVDETNIPDWYKNDLVNQEDRAREAAKKWFKNFPDNLLDGYKETGGDSSILFAGDSSILFAGDSSILTAGHYSKLTAGNGSKLNAGNGSKLNAGNDSILTAGNDSTLTAGNNSILTAGNYSILTAGNYSIFCAGENSSFSSIYCDGQKYRTVTFHVGKKNILPNKKYKISNGKIYDEETGERIEPDKTLKKKAKKNKE